MNTYSTLRKDLLAAAWVLPFLVSASAPSRGTLHLDGILVLRGDLVPKASLVVIPLDAPESRLEGVEGRFAVDLQLDHAYLLSFEMGGMVTKQIYFDTSVPVERLGSEMEFPFKVTLNPEGKDGIYAYAGPVGIVRYVLAYDEFGYETDYTLKAGAPMADRIVQLMARSSVPPPAFVRATSPTTIVTSPRWIFDPADLMNTRARTVRSEAPMVNRINYDPVVAADGSVPVSDAVEVPAPFGEAVPMEPTSAEPVPVLPNEPEPSDDAVIAHDVIDREEDLRPRSEELIVDRMRVTTVVRITEPNGHVVEYRRVADRYGNVVHFQDGRNIPASVYHGGTGR